MPKLFENKIRCILVICCWKKMFHSYKKLLFRLIRCLLIRPKNGNFFELVKQNLFRVATFARCYRSRCEKLHPGVHLVIISRFFKLQFGSLFKLWGFRSQYVLGSEASGINTKKNSFYC